MTPTPEQIEKAGYWFNKNIRARKTVEQLSTAYVLAAYAAHCVAEAVAEKDTEIARLKQALSVIESMDADYRIGTDSNMERLRVIARAALEQEKKPTERIDEQLKEAEVFCDKLLPSLVETAAREAMIYGVGAMFDGKHAPLEDVFKSADEEEKKP